MSMKTLSFLIVLTSSLFVGCESEDLDLVNKAQDCLNNTKDADYADATACRTYVDGLTTREAKIILCQIDLFSGGITSSRLIDAYTELSNQTGGSQEAIYMSALALTSTTAASNALATCKESGVESLLYIATMASLGTSLANIGGFLPTPGSEDSYTPPDETTVDAAIAACDAAPATCATDIGNAVITLGDSYCSGGNSDSDVCSQINEALANTDGSALAVGDYLLGLLNN